MFTEKEAGDIKNRHSTELRSVAGVCGVGVEKNPDGAFVIVVCLDEDRPGVQNQLPKDIEGLPVKFVISGPFRPFAAG
jgi:hypothetical protein